MPWQILRTAINYLTSRRHLKVTLRIINNTFTATMKAHILAVAALILGRNEAAWSQAKDNLRRMVNHNETNGIVNEPLHRAWATIHTNDNYTRVSSIAQRQFPRILLNESVCNATAEHDFLVKALGPSWYAGSLFQNVFLASERVDIRSLAHSLLEYKLNTAYCVHSVQENQYFGLNGEYTHELMAQHKRLIEFWNVVGPLVLLVGLHSDSLQVQDNTVHAVAFWANDMGYTTIYNITDEEIMAAADSVRTAIETELPNGYANSALTFSGYHVTLKNVVSGRYLNKAEVVIGDGFLNYFVSQGLQDVGSNVLHAKLFSGVLQSILELDDVGGNYDAYLANMANRSPKANRRLSLETDAMAAYALAHQKGRNFDLDKLIQVAAAASALGDCNADYIYDKGTPEQNSCASLWGANEGYNVAGNPVSVREFRDRFSQTFDLILTQDPSVCNITDRPPPAMSSVSAGTVTASRLLAIASVTVTACAFLCWVAIAYFFRRQPVFGILDNFEIVDLDLRNGGTGKGVLAQNRPAEID
jgi:hypothetical protein